MSEKFSRYLITNNKDNVSHYSCVIYRDVSSCDADYMGETVQNTKIRWSEHNQGVDKKSECAKHLDEHYVMSSRAPKSSLKQEILEAYFTKVMTPSLNN